MAKSKPFVLITGTTGMVGFRVLVVALEAGYHVRAAVRSQQAFDRIKVLTPIAPYLVDVEPFIVPDITVPGAYDEAVRDVDYIIHIAAPIAKASNTDYEEDLIRPSLQGTLGMLEAAQKAPSVKKIVITASVASVVPTGVLVSERDAEIYNEKSRVPDPKGPYSSVLGAYLASKKIAFNATEAFIRDKKPKFEVVSVGPGFIVGRDDTITDPKNIGNGSNRLLISRLLGNGAPIPASSCIAHIDDVAKVHVESLNEAITGNPFFMITTQCPEGPNWDDALEIVKRRYPKEVADGVFHTTSGAPTHHVLTDSSFTEKTFGIRFKTYEQAVVDVVNHYLELTGRK